MLKPKFKRDTVIIQNMAYVPRHLVDLDLVKLHYIQFRYEEASCEKCEMLVDRHSYMCDTCAAFKGKIKLCTKRTIRGKPYIGLPLGDKANFKKKAGLPSWIYKDVIDQRVRIKHGYDIEFTGELRDYQVAATTMMLKQRYGQLKAPPRSGKTVMAVYLTIKLGGPTLILAHQDDLLSSSGQMLSSFYEFTNIKDVEFEHKKKLIGIAKTRADLKRWPIVLSTYQKFINAAGNDFLEEVKKTFSVIIIDEAHKSAANCFSIVVNKFWAATKIGLTATPARKDTLDFVSSAIIGPVTTEVNPPQVKPKVHVQLTGVRPKTTYKIWHYAMAFLAKDTKRQQMIVDFAVRDVVAGHHIVIPVAYVHQANTLAKLIEEALFKKLGRRGLAEPFHSKIMDRGKILDKCKSGRIKVLVGIRQLIQAGINIPRWSCIYEISPISNKPNHEQEIARIRTPLEGKPQPLIRHFLDEHMGMCCGCFKTCFQIYKPFEWDPRSFDIACAVMNRNSVKSITEMNATDYTPVQDPNSGFSKIKVGHRVAGGRYAR
jgi:superfamily II DNA or RNA helicase